MRVLVLGDGIGLTTGFAQVIRYTVRQFHKRGWDITQVASLDMAPFCRSEPYVDEGVEPLFTHPGDPVGFTLLRRLSAKQYDAVFINTDPGTADTWLTALADQGFKDTPVVAYCPIEGAPAPASYARAFRKATEGVTYTGWSQRVLLDQFGLTVPFLYHGVDRHVFKPLPREERDNVREALGWDEKFVVTYVARNNGRKGHDKLLKALKFLVDSGHRDVLVYLHCKPYDDHLLQGWDLGAVAEWLNVSDYVQFADMRQSDRGEPTVSLSQKYAASDLYLSPSMVEGFGLPLIEAMAAGLPVVIPADKGNQEEVCGEAALARIEPIEWLTWFNGAQLCSIHPQHIAQVIGACKQHPETLKKASQASLARAAMFSWTSMAQALADTVERVAEKREAEKREAASAPTY